MMALQIPHSTAHISNSHGKWNEIHSPNRSTAASTATAASSPPLQASMGGSSLRSVPLKSLEQNKRQLSYWNHSPHHHQRPHPHPHSSPTYSDATTTLSYWTPSPLGNHNNNNNNTIHAYHALRQHNGVVSYGLSTKLVSSNTTNPNNYVAMDCEMVGVGPGGHKSALARVTLVDFQGNVLLDTFVRVQEQVTDYRTFVSGVRKEDLTSPYAISFKRCRKLVKKLIKNKILIGHGLINDFAALHMTHPWYNIRDSSRYEPLMQVLDEHRGVVRPRRLKDLCRQYLGISIQQDGRAHNPREDAWAAMRLYKVVQREWDYSVIALLQQHQHQQPHSPLIYQ